ncbi:MAG: serine/threonine-protein kinase [Cyanobacteriota bacterium]|nr:serine/threonine-protein kinase [Cyanobacteriota bacterium]
MVSRLLDGRYQILEVIESAEFGRTYLAKDTRLPGEPRCFVKHLQPGNLDPGLIKGTRSRFQKEAKALDKLSQHDRIPVLYAYFEENKEFYLVESYITGTSLDKEIVAGKPLPEEKVIEILNEVLEVLVFVHGNDVIHRDLKPSNLIRRDTDGKLVLIDFGAVKDLNGRQGKSPRTVRIGTMEYMPIEQFEYNPQFNSDIYALGMIAIQALTGSPPEDLSKLKEITKGGKREIIWRHLTMCSPGLAEILDKMVCYSYQDRYQSAAEVLADLKTLKDSPKLAIDKRMTYRQELVRLSSHRGDISVVGREILDALRDSLEMDKEEADDIEDEVLNPYRKYKEKGERYEQTLLEAIKKDGYPFSKETREELIRLQQLLGVSDEDSVLIEERLAPKSLDVKVKKIVEKFKESQFVSNLQTTKNNELAIIKSPSQLLPINIYNNSRRSRRRRNIRSLQWSLLGVSIGLLLASIAAVYAYFQWQNLQERVRLEKQQEDRLAKDARELAEIDDFYTNRNYDRCIETASEVPETSSKFVETQDLLQDCEEALNWKNASVQELSDNYGIVRKVAFNPQGEVIISSGQDNTIEVLELPDGKARETFVGDSSPIWSFDVNFNDGEKLVAGTSDWRLILWDLETEEFLFSLNNYGKVWSVAISPDGKTTVTGSGDTIVRIWDTDSGILIDALYYHFDIIYAVAIAPDGKTFATGSEDTTIKVVDLQTSYLIHSLDGHTEGVRTLAISPDSTKLVSGSYDDTIKIWNLETGELINTLNGHSNDIISVAISPDGQFIASGSKDKTVKIWDFETGELLITLDEHTDEVYSVAFSPDGKTIASGSKDNSIRLWRQ